MTKLETADLTETLTKNDEQIIINLAILTLINFSINLFEIFLTHITKIIFDANALSALSAAAMQTEMGPLGPLGGVVEDVWGVGQGRWPGRRRGNPCLAPENSCLAPGNSCLAPGIVFGGPKPWMAVFSKNFEN